MNELLKRASQKTEFTERRLVTFALKNHNGLHEHEAFQQADILIEQINHGHPMPQFLEDYLKDIMQPHVIFPEVRFKRMWN